MKFPISSFVIFFVLARHPFAAFAESNEPPATQPTVADTNSQKTANESWRPISVDMTFSPTALDMAGCSAKGAILYLNGMHLTDIKPAFITKEPKYVSKPYYGAFVVGNGPKSVTYFSVDQIPDKPEKIYVDYNQDGDLTDDGPGDWQGNSLSGKGETVYNSTIALHASWGSALIEKESGLYSYFLSKVRGQSGLGFYRTTARIGKLELDGKSYYIMLEEHTGDAIYTVPVKLDRTRQVPTLYVDLDGDGTFKGVQKLVNGKEQFIPEQFLLADPVHIADRWFFVRPDISGSNLKFIPVVAPDKNQEMNVIGDPFDSRTIVKDGTIAPDFTAQTPDAKPIKLSDFKGKVVLLDFWATWCVPCQKSMPPLEKIYQQVKDQGVVVLSVNVLDEKKPFDAWIAKHNATDYNFTFAFDPAGKDDDNHKSIATSKYGVLAIPAMFVIDRDGKVFSYINGDPDRLKIALRGLGIKTN